MEPLFCTRFNGLMLRGAEEVRGVFLAAFPSGVVLDRFLAEADPGALLFLHHPIDLESGDPRGKWGHFSQPISPEHVCALRARQPYLQAAYAYANAGASARAQAILAQYRSEVGDTARKRQEEDLVHRVLGMIALADQRFDLAREEFLKADRGPDGPTSQCTICLPHFLSRTFAAAGMRDSAIVEYERYVTTPYYDRFSETVDPLLLPRLL